MSEATEAKSRRDRLALFLACSHIVKHDLTESVKGMSHDKGAVIDTVIAFRDMADIVAPFVDEWRGIGGEEEHPDD